MSYSCTLKVNVSFFLSVLVFFFSLGHSSFTVVCLDVILSLSSLAFVDLKSMCRYLLSVLEDS